ncbi:MAG: type II toxin-antitoxin system PemK/MazF family toxin [Caldilineaceae bacterium]
MSQLLTQYQRNDIVLVPFPFTNLARQKARPSVVVSSASYNARMNDLVVAAISSQITIMDATFDLLSPITHPQFAITGLRVSSGIKAGKIIIEQSIVYRKLGMLPSDLMAQLEQRLRSVFDLK